MQVRNLGILVSCQLISATGMFAMVTLGGIIGASLAPSAAFATLPLSMMVVAVAATTIPASMLMRRLGRRRGFMIASIAASLACLVALLALLRSSFALFITATMLFGTNVAFTHQYRYAAAESVAPRYVPRAVSFVLLGAIGGAFLGKELATRGQAWLDAVPYGGTMLALSVFFLLQATLFTALAPVREHEDPETRAAERSLRDIVRQPLFMVAVLGGIVSYGVMTLIMTATPLSMHLTDGYSLEQTGSVIRAHVLAMYLPSLFAGFLIERFGVARMMFAGALALVATSIVGLQGHAVMHYWWALVLLGIGWNFLYVGGTTLLTYTYSMAERFQAQAVNEFLVFGMSATASLLAGTVMYFFGWDTLMLIPIPVLLLTGVALFLVRKDATPGDDSEMVQER
jgi:MFS family permease